MNFENDPRSGLDVFRLIKAADRGADVVVISGETRPERLIQIMNAGITSFIPKPCTPNQIRATLSRAIEAKQIKLRALNLIQSDNGGVPLIGRSLEMQRFREEVNYVVKAGIKDILLSGETGTGKEVVARAVAFQADPCHRFGPIHCGAISDGIAESELFGHVKGAFTGADSDKPSAFEVVGGGYIFFDEIGDMPLTHQAKLLRVIQERKIQRVGSMEEKNVNFRSISATHVDLEEAIIKKAFREDLFYRISKAKIHIPALRERKEDIVDLVYHFIAETFPKRNISITEDSIELLIAYHWPGNVRQLRATIEAIGSRNTDNVIRESDICQALPQIASIFGNKVSKILVGRYGASLINKEIERFDRALVEFGGDRDKAAGRLGMSRATFYRRAKEMGLLKEKKRQSFLS